MPYFPGAALHEAAHLLDSERHVVDTQVHQFAVQGLADVESSVKTIKLLAEDQTPAARDRKTVSAREGDLRKLFEKDFFTYQ